MSRKKKGHYYMSAKEKVLNPREARQVLRRNGFIYVKSKGDHDIFERGDERITVTSTGLNRMVWRRMVKSHSLVL